MNAAIAREQISAEVELGRSGHRVLVALAASGFNVARGQNGFFTGTFAVVRLDHSGCLALASMANDATEVLK